MKEIRIRRMVLENFKCHGALVLDMEGENVSLYGDNAAGKTSVYDALTWLLFGKDSAGNGEKLFDIKPLGVEGQVRDHDAITAVETEFLVEGSLVSFRKTCREQWKEKDGEPLFEGNVYAYFADGVPVKKNAYEERIRSLVPEEVFRVLTSVSHFARDMKWQERRAVLFDMIGSRSDRELMAADKRFAPLAAYMGKLSLADCKARLTNERKSFAGIRDDAPVRISECRKTLAQLDTETPGDLEALTEKQEALTRMLDGGAQRETEIALREVRLELAELEDRERESRAAEKRMETIRAGLERCDRQIESCRTEWVQRNGAAFAGGLCPTCGQELPFEKLREASERFEKQKQDALRSIEQRSNWAQAERKELEAQLEIVENCRKLSKNVENRRQELREQAAKLEQRLLHPDDEDTRRELKRVEEAIRQCRKALASRELAEKTRQRIAILQQQEAQARSALAQVDGLLALWEEFMRYKAKQAEESVNGRFRLAGFRLFRECANGTLEERCDVVYRGIPWLGLNLGARVNVGIDIINTLSEVYGVRVPLFIDNAESVTELEDFQGQRIRLCVLRGAERLQMVRE